MSRAGYVNKETCEKRLLLSTSVKTRAWTKDHWAPSQFEHYIALRVSSLHFISCFSFAVPYTTGTQGYLIFPEHNPCLFILPSHRGLFLPNSVSRKSTPILRCNLGHLSYFHKADPWFSSCQWPLKSLCPKGLWFFCPSFLMRLWFLVICLHSHWLDNTLFEVRDSIVRFLII